MTDLPQLDASPYTFDPSYGYSLQQLLNVKPPPAPDNFDDFWKSRYQRALSLDPSPQLQQQQIQGEWRIFDLHYLSSDAFPIHGWLLLPASGEIKRGIIVGHGYGGRDAPDFHLPFSDAAILFPCFRGLSRSAKAPISTEPHWHVLHDIDKLDRYILGGCVEDIWLAVSAMLQLFPHLHNRLGYLGISFGGGIGAMALAFENRIRRAHLNVPSFGHQPLRMQLPTIGSANSVQQYYQKHQQQCLQVLQYYDAAIAAQRIKIPIHCACARFDPCVAPPGQFAVFNALSRYKELFIYTAGHYHFPGLEKQEKKLLTQLDSFFQPLNN